ncbi:pyocin knob domain-containing protein [Lactococcus lactis]|uniref:pyocin knob domain-containing protein n=1 Tax=Lactococcus lactis TaxID=1358 RepID=UPI0028BE18C9|nr:pyocin knob domain-containing protein [Lactococcus lactis]WNN69035.1 pyocin knob domain-containing protein [Lactococcus lactis]WPK08229.1 pyocin knob domain-containing protein [Lactococcus lactis]
MSYEKQTWNKYDELKTEEENIKNGAVVTDNRMNHMESGIGDNDNNLASHLANTNNPHKVTAVQIGLDKVINVKQASKVEFDSHTSNNSNPHKVTAAQVGLDKVDNVKQAAKTDFDSHVNNKSNPHAVTASQVGAYTKTETDAKFATSQSLTDLSNKVVVDKGNITSVTDLNSLTSKGFYRIGGLVGGTDVLNVPSELSGLNFYAFLTVTGALQELTVYAPRKDTTWTYSRSLSGNPAAWSPWSKTVMADDSGKVTVTRIETTSDVRTWVSLTLSNAGTAVLRYKTINGAVYLCGEGNWGSFTAGQSKTVCTLPPELRPDVTCNYVITTQNGSGQPMELQVQTGGNVNLWSGLASGGRYGGFVGNYPLP